MRNAFVLFSVNRPPGVAYIDPKTRLLRKYPKNNPASCDAYHHQEAGNFVV